MNNVKTLLVFTSGVTAGSVTTYFYLKDKFEKRTQEEINSVKEVYRNANNEAILDDEESKKSSDDEEDDEKPKTNKYDTLASLYTTDDGKQDYTSYSKVVVKTKEMMDVPEVTSDKPYVIDEDEFGAYDDYTLVGLTFYADDVLTDSLDEPIEYPEDIVGDDFRHNFVNDVVYVRNDRLQIDYEIIRDTRTYEQVAVLPD